MNKTQTTLNKYLPESTDEDSFVLTGSDADYFPLALIGIDPAGHPSMDSESRKFRNQITTKVETTVRIPKSVLAEVIKFFEKGIKWRKENPIYSGALNPKGNEKTQKNILKWSEKILQKMKKER